MKSSSKIIAAAIAIAVLLFVGWVTLRLASERWDQAAQQETAIAAAPLIQAIKDFASRTGDEPEALDELVPGYIAEIPKPLVGSRTWSYHNTKFGFALIVRPVFMGGDPVSFIRRLIAFDDRAFSYSNREERWVITDL